MPIKISVITVCYNSFDTIEETIQSVVNQTYPNVEYIIIDGGSTDGTVDIIRKYSHRLSYWISEPDKGIYDAMNKGINIATGDYIIFMNSGDTFFISTTLSTLFQNLTVRDDIIYGDVIYKTTWGEYIEKALPLNEMSKRMPFCHQSTLVRTQLMKAVQFDTSFKSSADYKFLYNCYQEQRSFLYIPLIISKYDLTKGMSLDNYRIKLREDARIWGIDKTPIWKIYYLKTVLSIELKNFIKHLLPKTVLATYYRKKIASVKINK